LAHHCHAQRIPSFDLLRDRIQEKKQH
jgi:hypothetical protein